MPLNLSSQPSGTPVFSGGLSIDNMSWWFWIKAGMGFTLGAGIVYVAVQILWFYIIIKNPLLVVLRPLTRF